MCSVDQLRVIIKSKRSEMNNAQNQLITKRRTVLLSNVCTLCVRELAGVS